MPVLISEAAVIKGAAINISNRAAVIKGAAFTTTNNHYEISANIISKADVAKGALVNNFESHENSPDIFRREAIIKGVHAAFKIMNSHRKSYKSFAMEKKTVTSLAILTIFFFTLIFKMGAWQ